VNPYGKETVRVLHIIYRPRKIEIYNPPLENILDDKPTEPKSKITTTPASQPSNDVTTLPDKQVNTQPQKTTNSR